MKKIKDAYSSIVKRAAMWWANFGTARKVAFAVGAGTITIVTGINQLAEFHERFLGNSPKDARDILRTISTNETAFVVEKPFEILEPTNTTAKTAGDTNSLHFIVRKMAAAHQRGAYDDAVNFAVTAEALLSKCDNHDSGVIADHVAIKSCLMEDSFYKGDYDRTIEIHKELQTLGDGRYVATRPPFMALASVAELLRDGKTTFFFSPHELGELKKWDKGMLEEYLSFLAAWGYLQPVMIDPWIKGQARFYYEEFFGFTKPLPYQQSFMLAVELTNGAELTSNEMSARWAGRKKFVPVDLDRCAIEELNLNPEEIRRKPLKMSLSFKEDQPEKVSIDLLNKESLGLPPETKMAVKIRSPWTPDKPQNLNRYSIVTVTGVYCHNIESNRIPSVMWIVIATLICMAFASPMKPK